MIQCIVLLIVYLASSSGVESSDNIRPFSVDDGGERIIGGMDATRGQFPWQVSIRRRWSNKHACGGALIGHYWILTAGHCTLGVYSEPRNSTVVLGIYKIKNDGIKMDILMIFTHPELNLGEHHKHDISLIRTKQRIVYSKGFIWPAAIPNQPSLSGTIVRMSGWGFVKYKSGERNGTRPDVLQYEQTTVISRPDCQKRMWRKDFIESVHMYTICTLDTQGHGSCHGDSGGPVIDAQDQVVGIISWGKSCAQGFPDVHVSTYYHKEWIELVMKMYDDIPEKL